MRHYVVDRLAREIGSNTFLDYAAGGCEIEDCAAAFAWDAGKYTRKAAPLPGCDFTSMAPPWPFTIPNVAANPRPRPVNFVVKKGSNMRARVAASIPWPSSVTERT